MENLRNSNNNTSNRKSDFSKFAPILVGALFLMNPNGANAQTTSNENRAKAEVSTSTILDRLNQKIGISLSAEYNNKVLDFVLNDTIMRTRSATAYTEEFIVNEMQKDRGISKQNQLLFIRSKIYGGISQKKLYNRLDDENENRSAEYKKSLKQISSCYEKYKKGFKTYMETGIAEADRRSAEADRRSAEADRRSAEADRRSAEADRRSAEADRRSAEADRRSAEALTSSLDNLIRFYNRYKKDPNTIKDEEISRRKEDGKKVIKRCIESGIDYRAILLKEVGDKKKVDAILKFYGVE